MHMQQYFDFLTSKLFIQIKEQNNNNNNNKTGQ